MRAVVYGRYGSPDELELREVPKPAPGENEVSIRVHATSINSWDYDQLVGTFQGRGAVGWKPRNPILGADVAGVVEAVGEGVTRFEPGDAVMGDLAESGWACLADYATADEKYLAAKPDAMSFAEAAALPQAGLLAYQALKGRPQAGPGKRVLVIGGGGGAGTLAIQMAKARGATVTGVDSAFKQEAMRSAGADAVLDYARDEFWRTGERYDLIFEPVAQRRLSDYARALAPEGVLVIVGGRTGTLIKVLTLGSLMALFDSRRYRLLVYRPNAEDVAELARLYTDEGLRPVIDSTFPLEAAADAFRHFGSGQFAGKVVITTGA